MPWIGWNKHEVRPQRQAPASTTTRIPATMGFTAINSSSPAPQTSPNTTDSTLALRDAARQNQQATVASAYLGRGKQDATPGASRPAPKKAANNGRKRATTAPDQANSKRRKTSSVADAMPAAKPRGKAKKPLPGAADGKDNARVTAPALQHEQALKSAKSESRGPNGGKHSAAETPDPVTSSSLISVIAPSTSMSSFQSTAQQTSVEALKTSSGHGTLLYNTSASQANQHHLRFSKPLYHRGQIEAQPGPSIGCTSGLHDAETLSDDDFYDDDEIFDALFNEHTQQTVGDRTSDSAVEDPRSQGVTRSTIKAAQRQPTPIATCTADNEEHFFDDDNDLAEAVVLAAETNTVSTRAKRTCPAIDGLPTPVHSETSDICVAEGTETKRGRANNDAIMIDSDDEDEEMIELEKAVKAAEKAGLKPRLRKQNMRDVGQHEDYGGGLLDELEKRFLGESNAVAQSCNGIVAMTNIPRY